MLFLDNISTTYLYDVYIYYIKQVAKIIKLSFISI